MAKPAPCVRWARLHPGVAIAQCDRGDPKHKNRIEFAEPTHLMVTGASLGGDQQSLRIGKDVDPHEVQEETETGVPSGDRTGRVVSQGMEALLNVPIEVLDHGFVRVVDYLGNDSSIVQAARVSYGAGTKKRGRMRG